MSSPFHLIGGLAVPLEAWLFTSAKDALWIHKVKRLL